MDRVYVLCGSRIDVVFVFAGALPAVAMEGLWAHPPTDELDHFIWYAGGVKGGGEAGSEGVPCEERCDGGAIEVGQRHAQDGVEEAVRVQALRRVAEEGGVVSVGDGESDPRFHCSQHCACVGGSVLVGERHGEGTMDGSHLVGL